jgi:hypothetical protein
MDSLSRSYYTWIQMLPFLPLLFLACATADEPIGSDGFRPNTMDTMGELPLAEIAEEESKNKKPKIVRLEISPLDVYTDTDIVLRFGSEDPEGLPVRTSIQWYVNDRKRLGQVARGLKNRFFRKGDKIIGEVKATDGTNEIVVRSAEMVVLNSPPNMLTKPGSLGKLNGVTIRAEDADGDVLRFYLEDAPPGLTIDPARGVLRYVPSEDSEVSGEFKTLIAVEDPEGERVVLPLTLNVTPGRSSGP